MAESGENIRKFAEINKGLFWNEKYSANGLVRGAVSSGIITYISNALY